MFSKILFPPPEHYFMCSKIIYLRLFNLIFIQIDLFIRSFYQNLLKWFFILVLFLVINFHPYFSLTNHLIFGFLLQDFLFLFLIMYQSQVLIFYPYFYYDFMNWTIQIHLQQILYKFDFIVIGLIENYFFLLNFKAYYDINFVSYAIYFEYSWYLDSKYLVMMNNDMDLKDFELSLILNQIIWVDFNVSYAPNILIYIFW